MKATVPNRIAGWLPATAALLAWQACALAQVASQPAPSGTQPAVASSGSSARAGDYEDKPVIASKNEGQTGSLTDWVQPLAALAAVVALIFLLRLAAVRLGRRSGAVGRGAAVEVLARSDLAPRCQLFLLRLGRRLLLVGLGPNGPATLSEITDPAEAAELVAAMGKSDGGAVGEVSRKIRSRLESWGKGQS